MQKRQVKFRLVHKRAKEVHYAGSQPAFMLMDGTWKIDYSDNGEEICEAKRVGFAAEEYTGVSDKNGKDIYEGDLTNSGAEIVMFQGMWGFWEFKDPDGDFFSLFRYGDKIEIVANKTENPELLTQTADRWEEN